MFLLHFSLRFQFLFSVDFWKTKQTTNHILFLIQTNQPALPADLNISFHVYYSLFCHFNVVYWFPWLFEIQPEPELDLFLDAMKLMASASGVSSYIQRGSAVQFIVSFVASLFASFYRAMHFSANARSWDRMSSVRLSVCRLTLVDCEFVIT